MKAFITGASSGIGKAYAVSLAGKGYDLVITARRKAELQSLAHELTGSYNVTVEVMAADLSIEKDIARLEKYLSGNEVDLLVNSAGFGTRGYFAQVEESKIIAQLTVHNIAPVRLTRAALPGMIERNAGGIIMVSSLGSFLTTAHYVTYSATKAFLNIFIKGLQDELAGKEISVQAVCPGLVKTGFMSTDEYSDFNYGDIPEWVWMSPEQVAEISLKKLSPRGTPLVIPGLGNRIFVSLLHMFIIGSLLSMVLSHLSRKQVKSGKPPLF